jgi:Zn-dependent M16 (insulinase) family peptidase
MAPEETGRDKLGKTMIKSTNREDDSILIRRVIEPTKPITNSSSMITNSRSMRNMSSSSDTSTLSERVTGLEVRLEMLEKEFRSFKEEVKADIRELRTYLFGGFVLSFVISLLLKLLRLM